MTGQWVDVTSYSRGERGSVEPSAWELRGQHLRMIVHRMHSLDGWFGTCHEVSIDCLPLQASDVVSAQAEALSAVRAKLQAFLVDAASLVALSVADEDLAALQRDVVGPATTATKPTVDSRVRWSSSSAGKTTTKTGIVIRVLAAYEAPPRKGLRDPGAPRDHESYLVRGDTGLMYWPRVGGLEVIS